jgi:hypothetical protein
MSLRFDVSQSCPCSVGPSIRSAYHAALPKMRFPDEDCASSFHPLQVLGRSMISLITSENPFCTSNAESIIPWVRVPSLVLKTMRNDVPPMDTSQLL